MRSWRLAVLSAVVIVGLLVLLWKVRHGLRPAAVARGSGSDVAGGGNGNGSGNRVRGGGGDRDDGPQPATDVPTPQPQAEIVLAGEQALREVAKRCQPDGDPGLQGQHITMHYVMVIADETAHVEGLQVIESDIGDAQLQDCIVRQIGTARWGATGAANASRPLQLHLRVGELRPDAGG